MRNFYVLNNGRVLRKDNTLYIENADGTKKPLPVENVDSLYLYGEIDLNTKFLNFLSQKRIPLHVFNYYGFYAGSYYPREYLNSGFLLVHQVSHYNDAARRTHLARELVRGSAHSLVRNLAYYEKRGKGGTIAPEPPGEVGGPEPNPDVPAAVPTDADTEAAVDASLALAGSDTPDDGPDDGLGALTASDPFKTPDLLPPPVVDYDTGEGIDWFPGVPENEAASDAAPLPITHLRATIERLAAQSAQSFPTDTKANVDYLRGLEGKMRVTYYQAWTHILGEEWALRRRVRRPPDNEINALISFGNSQLYTVCLSEIYRTQLTPTIAYLHEPGDRRYSLALDLSEIFKPLIVDRAIFKLINTGQLKKDKHFDRTLNGCFLNNEGRKLFLSALEERLGATIKHRTLGRHVSYRHLIRLECYKLIRHLTGADRKPYHAFRAWW